MQQVQLAAGNRTAAITHDPGMSMRQTLIQSGLYPTYFQLPLLPTGLMGSWSTSTWQAASRSAQTSEVCTECMNAEVHCPAQEGAWNWQLLSLPVLADYPPRDLHL